MQVDSPCQATQAADIPPMVPLIPILVLVIPPLLGALLMLGFSKHDKEKVFPLVQESTFGFEQAKSSYSTSSQSV